MRDDIRRYGWATALFNLRYRVAWGLAKALIRRPLRLTVKER